MKKIGLTIGFLALVSSTPVFADANLHGNILHASTLHNLTTMIGLNPFVAISGIVLVAGIVYYRFRKAKNS